MRFCCRWGGIRCRFSLQWLTIPCLLPPARPLLQGPSSQSPKRRPRSTAAPQPLRPLRETYPAPPKRRRPTQRPQSRLPRRTSSLNRRRPTANDVPPRSGPTKSALSCAASPSTMNCIWCAPPRSRWRCSDMRSSPTVPKTTPPGALFAILSVRTGWPRPLKSARNSSTNSRPRPDQEVDAAAMVVRDPWGAIHCRPAGVPLQQGRSALPASRRSRKLRPQIIHSSGRV